MKPIELTRRLNDGGSQVVYCNPARIEYFVASRDGYEAYVYLGSAGVLHVTESPGQIIGRLADHRSAMRTEEHDGIQVYR